MSANTPASARPRICVVTPTYPPAFCGVADYTSRLVEALGDHYDIHVICSHAQEKPAGPGTLHPIFDGTPPSILKAVPAIAKLQPDHLILQYEPFAYGGLYGFNPYLYRLLRRVRKHSPRTTITAIVHEGILPVHSIRRVVHRLYHLYQLRRIASYANTIVFATELWVDNFSWLVGRRKANHIPIGSTITPVPADRAAVRAELGIDPDHFVICFFGRAHKAKMLHFIRAAYEKIAHANGKPFILALGNHEANAREHLNGLNVLVKSKLAPAQVSRFIQAADLYLVPLDEGVSMRRSTFHIALDHGLPVLATVGPASDRCLRAQDGKAFVLTPAQDMDAFAQRALELSQDPARRAALAQAAKQLYDRDFSWQTIARRFHELISPLINKKP